MAQKRLRWRYNDVLLTCSLTQPWSADNNRGTVPQSWWWGNISRALVTMHIFNIYLTCALPSLPIFYHCSDKKKWCQTILFPLNSHQPLIFSPSSPARKCDRSSYFLHVWPVFEVVHPEEANELPPAVQTQSETSCSFMSQLTPGGSPSPLISPCRSSWASALPQLFSDFTDGRNDWWVEEIWGF